MRASAWAPQKVLAAAVAVITGAALLILSGGQLIAELSRIPANSYYNRFQASFLTHENGPTYVKEAADRLQQVSRERRGWPEWRRLAAVLSMRPTSDDAPEALVRQQATVISALHETLARNPVQALGWSYLANNRMPPTRHCRDAMAALRQSFAVAPVAPDFVAYRLELAARCPLEWDRLLLDALRADLLALYNGQPAYARKRAFAIWLSERPRIANMVQRVLSSDTDALATLQRDLNRLAR